MKYPARSEVWLVDLGFTAKIRPCVVVSGPIADVDRALITLVPHTTSVRGTDYEISIPASFLKKGAFNVQDLVTVSVARAIRRLGTLRTDQMQQVERILCKWLVLPCNG